jgi:hypothetical protein
MWQHAALRLTPIEMYKLRPVQALVCALLIPSRNALLLIKSAAQSINFMSYRSVFSFLMIMVISVFVSCSEDEKIVDKPVPEISFEHSEQKYFSGVTDLTFQSSETQSIARVRILVDNVEVTDVAFDSPYDEFTFSWDSKSVEDGEHTITVIVTDVNGNEVTEVYEIVIRNILMKYIVEPASLFYDDVWIFLSDKNGNSLGVQQLIENSEVVFYAPEGFQDETFTITEFSYRNTGSVDRVFYTSTDMKPRVVTYKTRPSGPVPPAKGQVHFSIAEIPSGYEICASGRNMETMQVRPLGGSVNILADDGDLLITLVDDEAGIAKYKWLMGVHANDEFVLTLDEFDDFDVSLYSVADDADFLHIQMSLTDEPYSELLLGVFWDGANDVGVPVIHPPAEMFDRYFSLLQFYEGNTWYVYSGQSHEPVSINPLPVTVDTWDFSGERLNLSVNGEADFMEVSASKFNATESGYLNDKIVITTAPNSEVSLLPLVIPTEIFELYFKEFPMSALTYNVVSFTDDVRLNSYDDYSAGNYSDGLVQSTTKIINLTEEGGRISTHDNKWRPSLAENPFYQLPDEVSALIRKLNKK